MQNLHLMVEEEEYVAFSVDEGDDVEVREAVLIGKVLSPITVHASKIVGAMTPARGNPYGLKVRSIGEKENNLFV